MTCVINDMPASVPLALVQKCASVETATIGHIRHRGCVDREIQNVLGQPITVVGTAVTLAILG